MTKDKLRDFMKAQRRALTSEDIYSKSRIIQDTLFSLPCYKSAGTVMVFLSAFKEPDTGGIIKNIFDENKNCVVPISDTGTFTITPSYIRSMLDLTKGAYGILEPMQTDEARIQDIDIALIPGIAFDAFGNRTGFGKGYYDRFLSEFTGIKIGICYDFQVMPSIPADDHDIKMDMIITEKRIYNDF